MSEQEDLPPIYSDYGEVIRRVLHAPHGISLSELMVNFAGCAFEVSTDGTRVGVIEEDPIGYEYATLDRGVGSVGIITDIYIVERENPRAPGDSKTWRRKVIATGPGFETSLHEWSVRDQESTPMVIVGTVEGDVYDETEDEDWGFESDEE